MIGRLNFYDIYGNLLPGLFFIVILYLPDAIILESIPKLEWFTIVWIAGIGYLVGHLVQALATEVFPSTSLDSSGDMRFPSEFLLDYDDKTFSPTFKLSIFSAIMNKFSINIFFCNNKDRSQAVGEAFFLCRTAILNGSFGRYSEQFQGLYVMMRGIMAASLLGSVYTLGWCFAHIGRAFSFADKPGLAFIGVLALFFLTMAVVSIASTIFIKAYSILMDVKKKYWSVAGIIQLLKETIQFLKKYWSATSALLKAWWYLSLFVFCMGLIISLSAGPFPRRHIFHLLILCAIQSLVAALCYRAYKYFANQFARTVYRDFVAMTCVGAKPK